MKLSNKIAKAMSTRDSTDELALIRTMLATMKNPPRYLVEGVMQASLDCTPIDRCEQQAVKVWNNTIAAILAEIQ